MTLFHKGLFGKVLHRLDRGGIHLYLADDGAGQIFKRILAYVLPDACECRGKRISDLCGIELLLAPVSLYDEHMPSD